MAVEENKQTHRRNGEELWVKRNTDVIKETMDENYNIDGRQFDSYEAIEKAFKEHWANPNEASIKRITFHEMIGEGDYVASWQTNFLTDGTIGEGVSTLKFKDGKVASAQWFMRPPKETD